MSNGSSVILNIVLAHTFIAGIIGTFVRLYIASFLTSAESVNSNAPFRRVACRYMVFGMYFLISFLFSSLFISPLLKMVDLRGVSQDVKPFIYFVLCVPLAYVLYRIDIWIIPRTDAMKISARKRRVVR